MSTLRLLLRNLAYFRRSNLAVAAGAAVATAVLTGALMVGDSVSGSLRELALEHLAGTDHALTAAHFFPDDLAKRLSGAGGFADRFVSAAPAITMRGSAAEAASKARAAGVQIAAIGGGWLSIPANECVPNGALAEALGLKEGGAPRPTLVLSFPTATDVPRDATLARRGRTDTVAGLRAAVSSVLRPPAPFASFTLVPTQRTPLGVFVPMGDLQDGVDQPGRVNQVLVRAKAGSDDAAGAAALNQLLRPVLRLDDYALTVAPAGDYGEAALTSRSTYLRPTAADAAGETGKGLNAPLRRVTTYLLNTITLHPSDQSASRTLHYAIVAGLDSLADLAKPGESTPKALGGDEIAINQWTADRLRGKVGDRITLAYYHREANGNLAEVSGDRQFRIAAILPMSGIGADPTLTPAYKGFTDADSIANWEAPEGLTIHKEWVTKADEDYWHKYRAAPKVFLNLDTARKLWGNTYGDLTGIRLPAGKAAEFEKELLRRLDPAAAGLVFQPVKAQHLAAASGSTDFSGLFIGFSFFLIAAAALLVAMLFRLNIEQRARQVGLLTALGFTPKGLRGLALVEGMLLALVGGVCGLALGVAYTALMIYGLRTWWVDAVGTTALRLHVVPATLVTGLAISLGLSFFAILWGLWRVGRTAPAPLLNGAWGTREPAKVPGVGRRLVGMLRPVLGGICAAGGLALLAAGWRDPQSAKESFLSAGFLLLIACLLLLSWRLRPSHHRRARFGGPAPVARLGLSNASRHSARSTLTAALIAFATFTLVTVAAFHEGAPENTSDRKGGAGGFPVILTADIPLLGDLNTPTGRNVLGVRDTNSPLWSEFHFVPLRSWAGQDVSCLNLTQPTTPTILGVPETLIAENRFTFARQLHKADDPWTLLNESTGDPNVIPVVADDESAQYILKLGLGGTLPITDQLGRARTLKLVATLNGSIFQSEVLMSEANFTQLFPLQSGFGTVLAEPVSGKAADTAAVRRLLSSELDEYSVTVEPTAERLAAYHQVANTYLSTFQTLGSLGLMLGTIGLAVVLLRSLFERRSELALLSALGFTPGSRLRLVLSENAFLLVLGLVIGAACALLGILPTILSSHRPVDLGRLLLTLGFTLAVGLVVLSVATYFGSRQLRPGDLRAE